MDKRKSIQKLKRKQSLIANSHCSMHRAVFSERGLDRISRAYKIFSADLHAVFDNVNFDFEKIIRGNAFGL